MNDCPTTQTNKNNFKKFSMSEFSFLHISKVLTDLETSFFHHLVAKIFLFRLSYSMTNYTSRGYVISTPDFRL